MDEKKRMKFSDFISQHACDVSLIFYVGASVMSAYIVEEFPMTTQNKYIVMALTLYIVQIIYQWLI